MRTNIARNRYHPLSIGAHWLTLLLLAAVYALIELRDLYPKGSDPRAAMEAWHYTLGMTVFGLTFIRLALSAMFRAPSIEPAPPKWQQSLAHAMHWMLYGFLIVMPILGWLTLSAKGKTIPFFGLDVPALIGPDKALGKNIEDVHETIGTLGYYLIGLHALAALFHHYFMRDDTLRRMLPWRARSAISSRGDAMRAVTGAPRA